MEQFTLAQLEEKLSKRIGDYFAGTTTAAGASDGTTLISTDLLLRPGQSYVGQYCEITSGTRDGDIRVIKEISISGTTATLTPYNAFGGAIAISVTFRIHRTLPAWKLEAINESLREFSLWVPKINTELIETGELLRNGHFEFWRDSDSPFDWETVAGTVARITGVYEGLYALGLTAVASNSEMRQRIALEGELENVTITMTGWVYGTAGAGILLRLSQGSNVQNSPALSLTNTWERLTVSLTPSDSIQPIYAAVRNVTAVQARFDALSLLPPDGSRISWVPISEAYKSLSDISIGPLVDDATTMPRAFRRHSMPSVIDRQRGYGWFFGTGGVYYPYPELINQSSQGIMPTNYLLRLMGEGKYPTLIAEADTVSLTEEQATLLALLSALRMLHKAKGAEHISDVTHWQRVEADVTGEIALLGPMVRVSPPNVRIAHWRVA